MGIKERLETILYYVQRPGRYIGGESNQIVKDRNKVLASIALLFPDVYEMGMSHYGSRLLYHQINADPDLCAERAFAPAQDMAEQMRSHHIPLYTLESYSPITEFSAIGISIQTGLNYTNIPYMLELGGLNPFREDRFEHDPLIIGGGASMTNPEPVADFFDLFLIGEAEGAIRPILGMIGQGRLRGASRREILTHLSELPGVYVPEFLETGYNSFGEISPILDNSTGPYRKAQGVKRHWTDDLDRSNLPARQIVPHLNLIHERFSIEVMRGCTQGCRFCQAGYWYRPTRELDADHVIGLAKEGLSATGEIELGLLSLSTSDYSRIEDLADYLVQDLDFNKIQLSLPSLRVNSYQEGLALKAAQLGFNRNATFAPETGSERLRRMINKNITNQEIFDAAENAFRNGFQKLKLYTMVGLPTETIDDMQPFCQLIAKLDRIARSYGKRNRIRLDIGIMTPKTTTPMQWIGFASREKIFRHIGYILSYFKSTRSVDISWADYDLAHVEAFYSRGDRSLSRMIYAAYQAGEIFESFSEHFDYSKWQAIWEEFGYDQQSVYADRDLDQTLPWDFIHPGVSKEYLKKEYHRMLNGEPTVDCKPSRKDCHGCGIPGNYSEVRLSAPLQSVVPQSDSPEPILQQGKQKDPPVFRYLLVYKKTGLSRFIAHHVVLELLFKTLRRLNLKSSYTKGFHPKPIIKNPGALPVGMGSLCEIALVELQQEPIGDLRALSQKMSQLLPEGMDILEAKPVQSSRLPRSRGVVFRLIESAPDIAAYKIAIERFNLPGFDKELLHRDRTYFLKSEVRRAWIDDQNLYLSVKCNSSGAATSPYLLFSGLLDRPLDALRDKMICKERLIW
ncbi:MAG: hypothetical protein B6244_01450 [Candidatus Cloacimonetes bacterium 4572_55]|nr:MAG: hypothetical protein B6244_01450 [Candidatus Cloacimonetes bacterium 4572_55]